jgi:polyketide biosynthesis enoyl-CoA hydratase PksH
MAGGMGFLAASDVVIADRQASFCLSEMLFGLYPALVFPFLCKRMGFAKANYMTLSTMTLSAEDAAKNGLVDVCGEKSNRLLAQHLGRLTKIPKESIISYKNYVQEINPILKESNGAAVKANFSMFQDEANQKRINDFTTLGKYPWES